MRDRAFAKHYTPTIVDRFGVWLSARQIRRWVPSFAGKRLADLGCGYHATFARTVLNEVESATLLDVALAPDLIEHPRVLPALTKEVFYFSHHYERGQRWYRSYFPTVAERRLRESDGSRQTSRAVAASKTTTPGAWPKAAQRPSGLTQAAPVLPPTR